ncbi:hypothetical protein ACQP26_05330 [Micromonospora sp. CA-248089]|uniref:hypothetical protein n=1 Tax=Micromonospora sp. CA-248089 TaxID=3239960 RepID=UPI003D8C3651
MRRVLALLGIPLLALSACATPGADPGVAPPAGPDQRPAFTERAEAVAAGWRPVPGWRDGYVPLQEPTVLTGDPGASDEAKTAFSAGWYRDQIPIPAAVPKDGTIRFPDGTLRVPLVSAADAYAQLRQGDPPPCDGRPAAPDPAPTGRPGPNDPVSTSAPTPCVALTVTGVRLGTAPVWTSRGRAEVPAWLFTVDELAVPVARVAVAPRVTGRVPGGAVPGTPLPAGLVSAQQLRAVEGNRIDYLLGVGACDGPPTPLVLERPDVVVIGGAVVSPTGPCTMQLVMKPVSVTLAAPVGGRVVLDAGSGAPLIVQPG